jgi:DNA transposition AAA+ family ATPase
MGLDVNNFRSLQWMQEHTADAFQVQKNRRVETVEDLLEEDTKEIREEDMDEKHEEDMVVLEEDHLPSLTMEK